MKRGFTLIELMIVIGIVIVLLMIFATVMGSVQHQKQAAKTHDITEEDAAANRHRLLLKPVQTEGILPVPVEIPEEPMPVVTVKLDKTGEMTCPHCGKKIKIKVE